MVKMGTRYGDAYDNGNENLYDHGGQPNRRATRLYAAGPTAPHHGFVFKAFTRESLNNIQRRKNSKSKKHSLAYLDPARAKPEPDPYLVSGLQLPLAFIRQLPPELVGKPIEDIDPYYADQETFVIISRGKELTRFSATKALCLFGPFHPIRRVVLYILVNPIFNLLVILTILTNCILMTIQGSETVEKTEIIFTIVYTTEMGLKVLARGFIMDEFTYMRDPWNWLDFTVIIMAYLTIVFKDLGNLSVMRTFRVLRALKTVAIIPGMKTIVGAVIDSVKNLKDVVVLTLFSLSVFSLLGLQIYMGQLTQKCIANGPNNMTDNQWHSWCSNKTNWVEEPDDEIFGAYRLCGNATGAQSCPPDHTCIQGFGPNPDYGFTNFDTFGWALICSFRLMTQDFWEGLYMQVLKTAGSWHIIFFIVSIFLGSIYLMNLILAIVAMSYNELQRRAEAEEEAAAEDEAAFLESCKLMEERLSERSSSTYGAHSSYRPSVEIGLVGQSLLASLCQNGLLGEHVRQKLNRQMMLPGAGDGSAGRDNIRSHSFSVTFEPGNSSAPGQHQLFARDRCGKRASMAPSYQYDPPPIMAAAPATPAAPEGAPNRQALSPMRRASSFRSSVHGHRDSPTNQHRCRQQANTSPSSPTHQSTMLNDTSTTTTTTAATNSIMVSEAQSGMSHFVRQAAGMQFVSSEALATVARKFSRSGRRSARSSTTSDRDLHILRQRAALIRIVSDDCSNVVDDDKTEGNTLAKERDGSFSFDSSERNNNGSSNYTGDRIYVEQQKAPPPTPSSPTNIGPHESSQPPFPVGLNAHHDYSSEEANGQVYFGAGRVVSRFHSEAAICKQPMSINDNPISAFLNPQKDCSESPPLVSSSSTTKMALEAEKSGRRLTGSQNGLNHSATGAGGGGGPRTTRPLVGGSTQTLHTSTSLRNSPTGRANHNQQLGVDRLGPQASKMHHLSVENFQQFGAARPHAGPMSSLQQQQQLSPTSEPSSNHHHHHYRRESRLQSLACQMDDMGDPGMAEYQQMRNRHNRARLESRGHIHPNTMAARPSISRPPHRSGMALGGPDGSNGPPASSRRLSQDFKRRASDWSRLSMSANVDLRRLLRLWSHTNPYQGRQSIGSVSNASQAHYPNQSGFGSPARSIRSPPHSIRGTDYPVGAYASQNNSPRPSSVGSTRQAYELISAFSRHHDLYPTDRGYAIPLDDSMIDRMSVNFRDKSLAYCLSCLDILCIWECCGAWIKIQRIISIVVFDPFTELFIILCILINTLFMALDSDDADSQMKSIFERGNYFFTATFAVEASMKIMALSPKFYFREGWNVFDSIIVGLSLLELGLEGVYGLSVLRSFRLLRVFKLAKSWPTLNLLISIMGKAVGDLGNLTFVLAIIVFIFAVMGMQLFGNKYVAENFPSRELPRWNFTDFMHSFMIVFRILCAEWIEPMWDCLLVGGWPCIPFFLIAVTVGNLVVLNLFLALLLASFGASNLSSPQADNVDTKKLQEAIGRFSRFGRWIRRRIGRFLRWLIGCKRADRDGVMGNHDGSQAYNQKPIKSHIAAMSKIERLKNIELRTEELKSKIRKSPEHHYHLKQLAKSQLKESSTNPRGGGGSNTATRSAIGFNYNYNYTQKHYSFGASSNEDGADPTGSGPIPMIPIIVNEVSEGDNQGDSGSGSQDGIQSSAQSGEKSRTLSNSTSTGSELAQDLERASSTPSVHTVAAQATDIHHHSSSKLKDAILMNSNNDGGQGGSGAFKLSTMGSGRTGHLNYSATKCMQPIREDSYDVESSTSLSELDCCINKSLDKLAQDEVSLSSARWRSSQNSDSNSLVLDQTNPKDQSLANIDDCKNIDIDENVAVRESLLESCKPSASTHQLEDARPQSRVTLNQNDTQDGQASPELQDESEKPKSSLYLKAPKRQDMEEEDEKALQHIETYIEKCICIGILCLKWFLFRQYVRKIVEHKYFDQCILVLIVISSGTLALEDKHLNERPNLKRTLDVLDTIFTIIFSLEMIFKWLAFGIKRYFGNIWSWLDFVIVLVSFVNLMASIFGSGKIQALKTMRTLRAMRGLRPLRALQRFQGMRVVVNALIQAIPSIFNVLLVCLIFWLIFSIMGVQMFGGKFWRCLNPETDKLVDAEVASNRIECIERNLTWSNPQINFDNVLNAYLALFQVATFKGWIDIMNSASDSRARDDQPIREANIYMYFYFVFFVIFGSFFTLNLFIGVIIDNFNEQKKKTGGSLEIFMTDDQKKYYHAMKKMRSKRPIKAMTRPKLKLQALLFDITTSKKFDMGIMLIIGLNMLVMALEHYGQSQEFSNILENLNLIFIAIFTLECLSKIFAMRHFYFREPWNIFDFIVVVLSILGVVLKEYVAKYFVSPTLLRVVRVVKVGRVLRLVKGAKGIRTLLFALAMSLPALFNICLLLFLVMFIYAIFGMSFFMNVRPRGGIDETFNFHTFSSSIIVLFEMSTSAGWDLVLDPLMDEENDCVKPDPTLGIEGTCGNKSIAIFYLISYVIVTFLIIINMYIAVILENYSQATEDVQEGLTDDDYEMYYEIWQKFDPDGIQYLPYSKLSDFVDALEDPLRIPKPNDLALVVMDINIYEGNQCYCVDILDALTKFFFTRKGLVIQVNEQLQQVQSTLHETPFERITTTFMVKRENYCAKIIQNCWRKWRERTKDGISERAQRATLENSDSSHNNTKENRVV